jgi:hypothetical protein
MLNPTEIQAAIAAGDATKLAAMIKRGELALDGAKLKAPPEAASEAYDFWDRRQLIKKILLNS